MNKLQMGEVCPANKLKITIKRLIAMKLVIILTIILCINMHANIFSQVIPVKAEMQNTTIKDVLTTIEAVSNIRFFYNDGFTGLNKKVSVLLDNNTLEQILKPMLNSAQLTYHQMDDKFIVITPMALSTDFENKTLNQVITVTGTVTENGEALPGVNVIVKGTLTGVVTDVNGKYSITVPDKSAVLVFSFVGYTTQEVPVGDQRAIDIVLGEDTKEIEEVVVVGYGTLRKKDLTGAVASIKGEKITEKASFVKVSEALQGMTPGLTVTRNGGSDANASSSIRIRGVTTIGDSDPLIIVDGIPSSSLDRVNPNDVENISVLKDAASAAIYGSRGAAGVIVVTTKRAKEGHLNMSYDYSFTFEQPTRLASYTDAVGFMKILNERSWNDNKNVAGGEYSTFSKDLIDNYYQLHAQDPDNYPDTDWHDLMMKDWITKNRHMFSLSAGSNYIKSYLSLNVDDTEGLYMGKGYDRLTLRSNNDITINKYFSAELNLHGLYAKNTEAQSSQAGQAVIPGQVLGAIYPAEWSDGRIAPGKGGENPYAVLKHAGSIVSYSGLFGGKFQLNFSPFEFLKFSMAYSAELYNIKTKNFRKQLTFTNYDDPLNPQGLIMNATTTRLQETRNDRKSSTLQFLANFNKNFDKHGLQVMIGYEENTDDNENLGASRDEYTLKSFPYLDLGNANYQFNSGNATEYANRSFFGRIVYDYDGKYLLQSNIRYDGSSRFHKDHRWGLFPSVSAGWVVSRESFMEDVEVINFLKVRASWGRLGNERIGLYPYQSTIGFSSPILFKGNKVVAAQGAGIFDYTIQDISWETTESYDIGVDLAFLNNRLTVTADYYKKTTKDMLLALQIPSFIGMNNPQQNTGKMNTKGWEVMVGWSDHIGDFRYSVSGHLSDSKSVMGDLGGTEFLGSQVKFKGSEFNEWYGYKSAGLYKTQEEVDNSAILYNNLRPGDVKYVDISGPDGVPDGKISAEYDRVLLGGSLPRFLYGGNIDLGYKNFTFGMIIQGVGKQNSYTKDDWVNPYYEFPSLIVGKSWSNYNTDEQNLKAKYPRLTNTNRSNNYAASDFWMFNGAYFRLKNISLSYTIPESIVSKLKLSSVRVTASASDLFSIDNYPDGWDPETTDTYWINRTFTLGISVKF